MWKSRINELLALLVIGDGVAALVQPRRHMRLWKEGPGWWVQGMDPFVESAALSRAAGVAEIAAGLWWAGRQRPE